MSTRPPDMDVSPRSRPKVRRARTKEAVLAPDSIRAQQREDGQINASRTVVYIGIAIAQSQESPREYAIGMTVHDGTYTIDFELYHWRYVEDDDISELEPLSSSGPPNNAPTPATRTDPTGYIVEKIEEYRREHKYKIAGGAITTIAAEICPYLPAKLWHDLDIVCCVYRPFSKETEHEAEHNACQEPELAVDEESDSVARKVLEKFGAHNLPRPSVMHGNKVGVDIAGAARITTLEDYYPPHVHLNTWQATMKFADELKKNDIKIAFFNTTPQGGGVALMRHALVRFLRLVGVKVEWYVPRPNNAVFRVTKNNHNILQGIEQKLKLEPKDITLLDEWVDFNAKRWLRKDGPLAPREQGGADIIIVDDPQMPKLVQIAKAYDPTRPVIYRSHIQVRADLIDTPGTSAAGVWDWIWARIQKCDIFISHPVDHFVPKSVPKDKVGYMPATTDWLDGLNKPLSTWDSMHHLHEFCVDIARLHPDGPCFEFPDTTRPYIVQIARFDPAKGIPDLLASYAHLRRNQMQDTPRMDIPQLVIAGHGAIDDPDATPVYENTMHLIETLYADIKADIIVMRVGPTDQILNALLQNAKVALQLSTREGFEVKVSEALHAGTPVIATRRGGIPLQVVEGRNGYLVDVDDEESETVAGHLHSLLTDDVLYGDVMRNTTAYVSDEVSTVGNALCWLYLADALSKGEQVLEQGHNYCWISDMARRKAGIEWADGESRLPRRDGMLPPE